MSKVVILRGLPGAGKSTHAKKLIENLGQNANGKVRVKRALCDTVDWAEVWICSADDFFIDEHGVYKFNRNKIAEAHRVCMASFVTAVTWQAMSCGNCADDGRGSDLIIVDNTNIHRWEYMPYVSVAEAFGHEVEIVEVWPGLNYDSGQRYAELTAARNTHNVPRETVVRMYREWEPALPWQKVTTVLSP